MKMDGWISHKIAFYWMGGWLCIDTLSGTERKVFFLPIFLLFSMQKNDIRTMMIFFSFFLFWYVMNPMF